MIVEHLTGPELDDGELLREISIPVVGYVRRGEHGGLERVGRHVRKIQPRRPMGGYRAWADEKVGRARLYDIALPVLKASAPTVVGAAQIHNALLARRYPRAKLSNVKFMTRKQYAPILRGFGVEVFSPRDAPSALDPGSFLAALTGQALPSLGKRTELFDEFATAITDALTRFPKLRPDPDSEARVVQVVASSRAPASVQRNIADAAAMVGWTPGDPEAVAVFNDQKHRPSEGQRVGIATTHPTGVAWHEIGHLLTAAGGIRMTDEEGIKRELARYDIHYSDLRRLSNYAGSAPSEGVAELAAVFFTDRKRLNKRLAMRAERMFNEWGGAT